jgi:hypothetical protein
MEYLFHLDDTEFEIIISRDRVDPDDKNFSIFWQYHTAAYAGEKLFKVSESFAYYVPCPEKDNPFRFEIKVTDIKRLALALRFIITGYYDENRITIRFNEQAGQYLNDAFEGKVESNTWGLLHIANNFLSK